MIVELALETSISPSAWAAEDARTILTAVAALQRRAQRQRSGR